MNLTSVRELTVEHYVALLVSAVIAVWGSWY